MPAFDFSFKGSCEAFVNGRGRAVAYGSYLAPGTKCARAICWRIIFPVTDEAMALYNLNNDKEKFRICAASR